MNNYNALITAMGGCASGSQNSGFEFNFLALQPVVKINICSRLKNNKEYE